MAKLRELFPPLFMKVLQIFMIEIRELGTGLLRKHFSPFAQEKRPAKREN